MTNAEPFHEIDWSRPWLAIYRDAGESILSEGDWLAALNRRAASAGLHNHRDSPLSFVPQAELPRDASYEAFISDTGRVPTRDNLHDFFNGLAWLTFPGIKTELNRLQAAQIAAMGIGQVRGAARDAATIFDENAALLITCDDGLIPALRQHRWEQALWRRRTEFKEQTEAYLFGHALLEKLVRPYKAITAHAWVLAADAGFFALAPQERLAWVDNQIASRLRHVALTTSDFTPLPVLGVPGWWQGQDDAFYADQAVFRPKR